MEGEGEAQGAVGEVKEVEETGGEVKEVKVERKVKPAKVEVRLQAAGDAPIMKQKNYKVTNSSTIIFLT